VVQHVLHDVPCTARKSCRVEIENNAIVHYFWIWLCQMTNFVLLRRVTNNWHKNNINIKCKQRLALCSFIFEPLGIYTDLNSTA